MIVFNCKAFLNILGDNNLTRRGKSHSRRPISKRPPAWCKYDPDEVEAFVIRLAKEGNSPSKIGVILRDKYGIPLVRSIVRKSIKEIIETNNLTTELPEDLNNIVEKATNLQRHLTKNRADAVNKRSLELIVSKVNRLAKYYKKKGVLPGDWNYKPSQ
jgi:small subunit ribosomal protein S15